MAYEVNFTNGTVAKLVEDGITDDTYSVKLVGKNVTAYGEVFAENFLALMENFANNTAPTNPVVGQLWFNTSDGTLNGISKKTIGVYDGVVWKPLGGASVGTTEPSGAGTGDLFYNTSKDQLSIYDGVNWDIVGPGYSEVDGKAGAVVETVEDDGGDNHIVTKIYGTEEGSPSLSVVLATISKDAEFTPATGITGFASIKPGIQLSSTVSDVKFHGEATSLSGYASTDFISAIGNDTTTGTLGVLNDGGLTVGASSDLTVEISTDDVVIKNNTIDGDITIGVNDGGTPTTAISIDGASGLTTVSGDPTANLGIATKQYVDTAESDAITSAGSYTDSQINALKSGASTNYDSFADVEARIGEVSTASTNGLSDKVDIAGSTMTGLLTLSGDPTSANHAATKNYVDFKANSITPESDENGYGTRTVSTSAPSGGSDGDIWYRI